jgi:hypothetical protein
MNDWMEISVSATRFVRRAFLSPRLGMKSKGAGEARPCARFAAASRIFLHLLLWSAKIRSAVNAHVVFPASTASPLGDETEAAEFTQPFTRRAIGNSPLG